MEHVSRHPVRPGRGRHGPENPFRVVLVVTVVGCVLTAWFPLRGHKRKDD